MDDDDSLIGFTNSLNEVRCTMSEDSVENPLSETQFLVRIEVSTQIYQLGNSNRRFEPTADSLQINEARIPPEIVEFRLFQEEEEEEAQEHEDDEEEEAQEHEHEDDEEEEEETVYNDLFMSQTVYPDIDRLVCNSVIKSRLSQTVKNVIWSSRFMLMEIAMAEKPKWIRLTLDIEVTKVYLELDEDYYEHIVNRVTRESFEAENENGNAVEPASRVSIEALETKKYEKEDDLVVVVAKGGQKINSCGICLDDFSKGVEFITKMPCTHVFHKECIYKWLEQRRTCPLCRFEMPGLYGCENIKPCF